MKQTPQQALAGARDVISLREMLMGAFDADCTGCWEKLEASCNRVARFAKRQRGELAVGTEAAQ